MIHPHMKRVNAIRVDARNIETGEEGNETFLTKVDAQHTLDYLHNYPHLELSLSLVQIIVPIEHEMLGLVI